MAPGGVNLPDVGRSLILPKQQGIDAIGILGNPRSGETAQKAEGLEIFTQQKKFSGWVDAD